MLATGIQGEKKEQVTQENTALTMKDGAGMGGKEVSRYIDADKVAEQLKEYIDEYSWVDENGLHGLKWCAMIEALDVVEEAAQQENKKCDWCTSYPECGAKMGVEE